MGEGGNQKKMDEQEDYIELFMTTVIQTPDAVLLDDGEERFFVPKSVLKEYPETESHGSVLIKEWYAYQEGLI